jgi:radical SAM protein
MHPPPGAAIPKAYDERPILVFWEMTKACPLACAHCRAHAQPVAMPGELGTEAGTRLLQDLQGFGEPSPILVLTGGDPLARADFFVLLEEARRRNARVALAPAVSKSLGAEAMDRMRALGINAVSISLDGAVARTHEAIRQIAGHFQETLDTLAELVRRGFTVQVNTTVMRKNVGELADIAVLLHQLGVHVWEVFFLVRVGRGSEIAEISAAECDDVAHFLFEASRFGFVVRTVEGPFFRRVVKMRTEAVGRPGARPEGLGPLYDALTTKLTAALGVPTAAPRAQSSGTRDGNGILFIAHDGGVYPAGFLPVPLGNVVRQNVVDLYRSHPLLQSLRRATFTGRCGACEYRELCGGSRSRAFAAFGDPLAEDPACAYVPPGTRRRAVLG